MLTALLIIIYRKYFFLLPKEPDFYAIKIPSQMLYLFLWLEMLNLKNLFS